MDPSQQQQQNTGASADDQQTAQESQQQMTGAPLEDPNMTAFMQQQQQQIFQQMGYFMPPYDPATGQFYAQPYGGYPQQYPSPPVYGGLPMMFQQQPQPSGGYGQQPYSGGNQGGYQGGNTRPYSKGHHQNNYQGGNRGGYQNNNQTASKFNPSKYKTQMCRHFQSQGSCQQGDQCLFAHGDHELRKPDDAVPLDVQAKAQSMSQPTPPQRSYDGGNSSAYQQHRAARTFQSSQNNGPYGGGGRGGYQGGGGRGGASQGGYHSKPHYGGSQNYGGSQGGSQGGNYKTQKCKNFDMGNCHYGDKCTYAHGDKDLRKSAGGFGTQSNSWVPVGGSSTGSPPTMPAAPQQHQASHIPMGSYAVLAAGLPVTAFPALGGNSQPNTQ